ncbi:arylamine N-acetyltransferase family protein [Parasphingopyxis marina]|uniref:Arylamine N-acetyltransferase n=1 Tax=Parasphingopyxis marina TaxID=2761622 RepID=A0A842I091_9SPHN|nr:arylamine N-acetyltransferase [Parasphingopyxis marina]MBC2778545.1 arylamine N-acetyltransferase [Parasphingopyxis marina]
MAAAPPKKPPSETQIAAYLARIGFTGTPQADLETLTAIHRGHVEAIPWDNLDVALGRPLTRDPAAAFDKLVTRRRGGWCYEMNGLLGWMLEGLGFRLAHLAGAVDREIRGDATIGNHLLLLVELDRTYIADTGFGTGLIEPAPLAEGPVRQSPMAFRLERLGDGWWRFHNHPGLKPASFDFARSMTDTARLEEHCRWFQDSPDSHFKGRVVVNTYRGGRLEMLTMTQLETLDAQGRHETAINTREEFSQRLTTLYGAELAEAGALWEIATAIRPEPDTAG